MKRYLLYLVFTVVLATAGCTRGQWLDEVVADRQYQANAVEELKEAKATNLYVLYVNKDKDENYTIHFSNNTSTSFNIINKEEDGHKYPNMLFVTRIVDTPTKVTITIDGNGEQALISESELTFYVIGRDGTSIPVNEIRYTTTDGTPISPQSVCFGSSDVVITSNVYKNSGGVITCGGDITLVDNAAFKGCGNLETITFPESLTTIGNSAFAECQSLKTVNLPENLTTIGDEVFLNCEALESIDLPSNITSIGFLAFAGCSSLREIVIPEGITTIVNNLFENCRDLVSVTLPEKVTTIGASAFAGCASLTNITIPESVIAFEDNAFSGCASLASINIPDLLHTIGKSAFNGCASLTKITLPTYNLKKIGEYAFYGCSKLTSINLPVVIDNIADFLLAGCSSLTNIEIPTLITSIGEGAFNGCLALEEINIPEKVTTIGASAFAGCSKLTSVTIPSGVTSIGRSAFYNCSNLAGVYCKPTTPPAGGNSMFHSNASGRKIYVPEKNIEAYKSAEWWNNYTDDFVAYDFVKGEEAIPDNFKIFYTTTDGKVLTPNVLDGFGANIRFNTYEDGRGAIVFDGEVTHIPAEAFQSSQTLATITIPEGVTTVEEGAFAHCLNLSKFEGNFASTDGRSLIQEGTLVAFAPFGTTKYTIPTSVTAIGGSACAGFDNLTSITIPEGVTSIGDYAFEGCVGFTTITIPESVTTIGCGALSGCSSLATVYCKPITPPAAKVLGNYYPTPSWNAFEGSSLTLVIYVPYVSVEAYKAASGWSTYADAFVAYDFENGEVFVTEKMKIYYTSTDGNIVTPNKTNEFGANIVSNTYADGQGVITFDGDVTKIGYQAFSKCSSLASINIPDSVTSIGRYAFWSCPSLVSITIPEGVTSIGEVAFAYCSSLTSITIPEGVNSIGYGVFQYCRNLAEVYCKSAMPPTAVPNASSSPYWDAFDDNASDRKIYVPAENVEAYKSAQWWSDYTDAFVPYDFEKGEVVVNEKMKIYYTSTDGNVVTPYATNVFGANIISNTYADGQGVITFGGEVTKIGNQAFSGCSSLTSITIPDSVTELGSSAFSHCSHLTSFTIPDNVLRVGSDVCMDCGSLKSITIGKSVEVIEGALWGSRLAPEYSGWDPIVIYCKATTPPTWTNTYESLTYSADVDVIYIPAESVEAYKTADEWRHYSDDYIPYDFEKGEVAFSEKMKIYYTSTDGQVVTPSSRDAFGATIIFNTYENGAGVICFNGDVTKIGSNAFYNCTTLASVTIPEGVTSIDENPFRGCTNLAEFKGKFASSSGRYLEVEGVLHSFAPAGLTEYSIHNKITSIGYSAFFGCKDLVKVTIPEGVKEIERNVFRDCSSLVEVYCKATVPPTAVSDTPHSNYSNYWNAFDYNASGRKIYVPEEALEAYKSAEGWMHYSNAFVPYDFKKGEVVNLENRKIYYTSTDGNVVTPYATDVFGANIISNTYADGQGVITFDGEVTKIGYQAFYNCSSLASVTIPESVTLIGSHAFDGCSSLASITIPDGVTSIGYGAFNGCSSLTSITIPDGVTSIGDNAFNGCSSLTSITIPDSVTLIGEWAFHNCDALTSITILEGVTSIGNGTFYNCSSLASITIPEGVTTIGDRAFYGCSSLVSVTIPEGVTSIGKYAFNECSSLTSITIPEGVTEIGEYVFYHCKSLASVTIPEGVTSIGVDAFSGCSSLASITIGNGVTSIGDQAFNNCYTLPRITIPESVTEVGYEIFWNCRELTEIYCKPTTPPTTVIMQDYSPQPTSWILFNSGSNCKIYVPTESVEAYKTAEGWSEYADAIVPYDFEKGEVVVNEKMLIYYTSTDGNVVTPYKTNVFGSNIVSNTYADGQGVITFDGNVTTIGSQAFYECSSLASITIPDGVTSIGSSAFYNCSSLASITIPESVTSIGSSAFQNCSGLTSITIPNSVTSIGSYAFYACSSLTSITIPEGVTSIGDQAFYNCSSLASVTIPDSVTSIGSYAFYYCSSLVSITIPEGVTEIESSTFYKCSSLASVTIPDSVASIGNYAFRYCESLASITIPEGVTSIGDSAFQQCTSLVSITIPESVTSIGKAAFCECSSLAEFKGKFATEDGKSLIVDGALNAFAIGSGLTEYIIPDSVTSIGYGAFVSCSSLESVTIPNSVTSIGYCAFLGCSSLTSVYCKPTTPPSGDSAMFNSNGWGRKIYVPEESVEAYKSAEYWSVYADAFVPYDFEKGEVVNLENRKIYYTSTDGNVVTPYATVFGANIVSNTYENGQGVITFDGNVTKIGNSAFYNCKSLASITIPEGVTSIGNMAFGYCSSLASITIPDSVTSIDGSAFLECTSLAEFRGKFASGDGCCLIVDDVFKHFAPKSGLTEYTIPDGVTSIGSFAFYNCSSLTSITIPDSVTSIEGSAFHGCSSLTSITIPEGVTSIGYYAFNGCSSLAEFSGKFASEDGRCLIVNGKLNSFAPAGLTEYVIPNGVTTIEYRAFYYCDELVSVTIPDGVTSIKEDAFRGCDNLASINIPEGVTEIGDYAFGVTKLTSVTLPESLTSLGYIAFAYCRSLKEVYCKAITPPTAIVPDSSYGWGAFDSNASGRKIYVPEESVEAYKTAEWWSDYADAIVAYDSDKGEEVNLENRKIYYTSTDGNVVTPYATNVFGANIVSNTYENGQGVITFDGNVTTIGTNAYYNSTTLASITIPDSVTSIEGSAFLECTSLAEFRGKFASGDGCCLIVDDVFKHFAPKSELTEYTIPDGVISIGSSAFSGCSSLVSITIPSTVSSIGGSAFSGCSSLAEFSGKFASEDGRCLIVNGKLNYFAPAGLTEYVIPNGVTTIEYRAFYYCDELVSVTIPDGVTSIKQDAFCGCGNLASINIPEGVTEIGDYAFGSAKLTSVTLPKSLTSLGRIAFAFCRSLKEVYCKAITPPTAIPNSSSKWGAFDYNASGRKIYVPEESVEAYKTAEWWSEYAGAIEPYVFE